VAPPWQRDRTPLVLAGHGAQLRVDAGTLLERASFGF